MQDLVTWAALCGVVGVGIALTRLWVSFYREIRDAKEDAATATHAAHVSKEAADETKRALAMMHNDLTMLNASFALYREQAAQKAGEFITRDMLRELEERIASSTRDKLEGLVDQVAGLTERFDRFLQSMVRLDSDTPRRPGR